MRSSLFTALCACCVALTLTTAAQAALVTVTFDTQNFIGSIFGDTPPQDPVSGSFSFLHDSAADFTGQAVNPVLHSISLTIDGYSYSLANTEINSYVLLSNGAVDFFQLGGILSGFASLAGGTDDFNLILAAGSYGSPSRMRYTTTGTNDIFLATNTSENLTDVTFQSSVIPLPSALPLLLSGGALLGWMTSRKRGVLWSES